MVLTLFVFTYSIIPSVKSLYNKAKSKNINLGPDHQIWESCNIMDYYYIIIIITIIVIRLYIYIYINKD